MSTATPVGAQATLADHVRARRDTEALSLIVTMEATSRLEPPVQYLKGRLLERTGKICQAADAYDLSNVTFPADVQTDVQRRWARASARCDRCKQALEPLRALAEAGGQQAAEDRAWIARCEFTLGNFGAAVDQYRALLKGRVPGLDRVDATLNLAKALRKLGEEEEARRVLERATISLAAHRRASKLQSALTEMGGTVPRAPSDRLRRAEVLFNARQYEDALAELESHPPPEDQASRTKWLHIRGMALFRMRTRYDEAARVLEEAAFSAGKRGAGDQFLAARALSRAGKDRKAIAKYRAFVRTYPRHSDAAEAEFLAGWLEIRLGLKKGELALERMVRGPRGRSGKWRRQALWELGFRAVEKRQYQRARKFLTLYAKEELKPMERAQAAYWLGRAYQGSRKWGLAVQAYREAITVEPLHWYATLAANQLQRMKREVGDPFSTEDSPQAAPEPFRIDWPASVLFYSTLGLTDDAVTALRKHRADVLKGISSQQETAFFAQAYSELGAHREAFRLAMRQAGALKERPDTHNAWWWNAAYPRPWHDSVKRWARQHGVEEAHVYGSMRQESAYNPSAVSPAGAVGLLQLMPKVASRLAKKAGVEVERQQLFDPEWNIRLGTMEMSQRHQEFHSVMPLTIAAYNAGSKRVREWIKRSGRMELDRFVERIPFNETKNYVRRVMSHYARYRYLNDPKAAWPVSLPRRIRPPG